MTELKTDSQFHLRYASGQFGQERSACGLFSVLSASEFLKDGDVGAKKHNRNIDCAIANFGGVGSGFRTFNEILKTIQNRAYKEGDVRGTSTELVKQGVLGFDAMFCQEAPYSVVFLKNGKFFVVHVDQNGFHLRDCHEDTQYDYEKREDLERRLCENYQFDKTIDLSGELGDYTVPEFSSIEFLVTKEKFLTSLDTQKLLFPDHVEGVESDCPFDLYLSKDAPGFFPVDELRDDQIHGDSDLMTGEKLSAQMDADAEMAALLQAQEMRGVDGASADVQAELFKQLSSANKKGVKKLIPEMPPLDDLLGKAVYHPGGDIGKGIQYANI